MACSYVTSQSVYINGNNDSRMVQIIVSKEITLVKTMNIDKSNMISEISIPITVMI